jgi:hypothetical protein
VDAQQTFKDLSNTREIPKILKIKRPIYYLIRQREKSTRAIKENTESCHHKTGHVPHLGELNAG